jgi:hypothetical protein
MTNAHAARGSPANINTSRRLMFRDGLSRARERWSSERILIAMTSSSATSRSILRLLGNANIQPAFPIGSSPSPGADQIRSFVAHGPRPPTRPVSFRGPAAQPRNPSSSVTLTKHAEPDARCSSTEAVMGFGRGALLWLLGIPLPIIILLALFWHH